MLITIYPSSLKPPRCWLRTLALMVCPRSSVSRALAVEGNFKDEGYKIAVFMTGNIGNNNDL